MEKWEYLVLDCANGKVEVQSINGKKPKAEIDTKETTLFGGQIYRKPYLFEYLEEVGGDGWEVCGISPNITGVDGHIETVSVILKRPLD